MQGWGVDLGALKTMWRKQMAVVHPDRMAQRPSSEQLVGTQQSSVVNKAYETLRRPLERVLYLLKQAGVEDVDEASSLDDPSLLMEVMELQEALSEAQNRSEADAVGEQNEEHLAETLGLLDAAFSESPLDTAKIQALAVKLRYWTNIAKSVQEWQPGQT